MDDILDNLERMPSKMYYAGVLGSIAVSIALYLSGRKHSALFVGLWAPTILNLGLYNKLLRPSQEPETKDLG